MENKYNREIAILVMHYGIEKDHIKELGKRKRKNKAIKERIEEAQYELPELFSAIKLLLKEGEHIKEGKKTSKLKKEELLKRLERMVRPAMNHLKYWENKDEQAYIQIEEIIKLFHSPLGHMIKNNPEEEWIRIK